MIPPPPKSTLFPYTTLFRSEGLRVIARLSPPAARTRSGSDGYELRSEEHTSELQSRFDLVCRLLLEKKNQTRLCESTQINHISTCRLPTTRRLIHFNLRKPPQRFATAATRAMSISPPLVIGSVSG